MTTLSSPAPGTGAHPFPDRRAAVDPDMDALLDMLDERGVDPPSVRARTRSIATAAAPHAAVAARRVAAADRRVVQAASVAVLFVLVSVMAAVVVAGETTARAVAACDLPRRSRTWRGRARVCADQVLAWPARVDRPV